MKIAIFTDTYKPQINGVVVQLESLIKKLKESHEVCLFAPSADKDLRVETQSKNFKIYWIPSRPFPFYKSYLVASLNYKRINNLVKKEKPDIIHAHAPVLLGLQGVITGKRNKIPIIITHHTHLPEYFPHLVNRKLPKFLTKFSEYIVKKIIKQVYKMANIVTTPTVQLVQELHSYGLKNVICLPNAIDGDRLRCTEEQKALFKKNLGITNNKIILYVGRLSMEKRLDVLLNAFNLIKDEFLTLIFVGDGPELDRLTRHVKNHKIKNVIFLGKVDDDQLGTVYGAADIFVSPSDTETFGLAMVEAMFCRLPAIGANRLGSKEIIQDGKNGYLVEPGNVKGFRMAIERFLENAELRRRMGADARESVLKFNVDAITSATCDIYKQLMEPKGLNIKK